MNLHEVRQEIDRVDSEIKKLFEERMHLADNVAGVKALTEDRIYKPEREADIIDRLSKGVKPEILSEYVAFIRKIIGLSRKYQYGRTLALLNKESGIDIVYSDVATEAGTMVIMSKDEAICRKAVSMLYGVDKNYFAGSDMPADNGISACRNIAVAGSEDEFTQLMDANGNDINKDKSNGTGNSIVNDAGSDKDVRAGMAVLEDAVNGVNSRMYNLIADEGYYINKSVLIREGEKFTRVAVISKELIVLDDNNRFRLMFTCEDSCGSLAAALSIIADYGINVTDICTYTCSDRVFNVELEAGFKSRKIQTLLFQLESETRSFRVLGSYTV